MKLTDIKKALLNKAESFLWYIAKGDKGLTRELNEKGAKRVLTGLIVWQSFLTLIIIVMVIV
ncbi:hypothetical protein N9878_01075 [bacterium]|nr:hypothetical protein [bacterium]